MLPPLLVQRIRSVVAIEEADLSLLENSFMPKRISRKQYVLQSGDVAHYQAFVVRGILRSYTVDEKHNEHILQFASEGWWIADLSSYLTAEPSIMNIDAIEDAELLLLDRDAWEAVMKAVPALEHYFRIIIQNHLVATQRRLLQSHTETAEEKYRRFVQTYPDCVVRVSQQMIASYLGISRETLSRIHRRISLA